jgi:hypothetical protein
MARKHAFIAALVLGVAAILGVVALGHTLGLGAASSHAKTALIARRSHQLDRFEASLRRQLRNAPAVPAAPAAPAAPAVSPTAAPSAQRVLYVRPKPIIVHVHRHGGDDQQEAEGAAHEGGADD